MDAERSLVSKVAQTGEIDIAISRGITEAHFADEECSAVYDRIIEHIRKYKTPPSMTAVKEMFPKFEFVITSDSTDFLIDKFISNVKRRMAKEMLLELGDRADQTDGGSDIDIDFLDAARQLATIVPSTKVARFSDMKKRIEKYEHDKEHGTPWGIRMGIPALDAITMGIQPHELVVCAGWQGTGKSTLMQFIAFNAYLQGFTPLFISLEMEHGALLRKFDTMAVDMNYRELKALELGDEAMERWEKWAEQAGNHKDQKDILIVDRIGQRTATGVFAETVRHKPDLVVVDYISLLDAPKKAGDKSWQQIGHISRELKLNAQTLTTPVIAAAQTNRDSTKEGVKLETIAFSSSIGMDADIVLGLNQDDDMRIEEKMEVVMVKSRDSGKGRCTMDWKMETMQFGERPPDAAFRKQQVTPPPEPDEPEVIPAAERKNPFLKED